MSTSCPVTLTSVELHLTIKQKRQSFILCSRCCGHFVGAFRTVRFWERGCSLRGRLNRENKDTADPFVCVRSRILSGACSRGFTNNFFVIERWMIFNGGLEISWQDFIIFICARVVWRWTRLTSISGTGQCDICCTVPVRGNCKVWVWWRGLSSRPTYWSLVTTQQVHRWNMEAATVDRAL